MEITNRLSTAIKLLHTMVATTLYITILFILTKIAYEFTKLRLNGITISTDQLLIGFNAMCLSLVTYNCYISDHLPIDKNE